eukprot:1579948-Pleurochrysis_carterae.AAC.1
MAARGERGGRGVAGPGGGGRVGGAGRAHAGAGAELLRPWAGGIVWDCRDPARCAPVAPSTRHTRFPGARQQVDRAALRR